MHTFPAFVSYIVLIQWSTFFFLNSILWIVTVIFSAIYVSVYLATLTFAKIFRSVEDNKWMQVIMIRKQSQSDASLYSVAFSMKIILTYGASTEIRKVKLTGDLFCRFWRGDHKAFLSTWFLAIFNWLPEWVPGTNSLQCSVKMNSFHFTFSKLRTLSPIKAQPSTCLTDTIKAAAAVEYFLSGFFETLNYRRSLWSWPKGFGKANVFWVLVTFRVSHHNLLNQRLLW